MFNQYEKWFRNRQTKKANYEELLSNEETPQWKKNQIITKLYRLNRMMEPKVFWDSMTKGTHKKPKEN